MSRLVNAHSPTQLLRIPFDQSSCHSLTVKTRTIASDAHRRTSTDTDNWSSGRLVKVADARLEDDSFDKNTVDKIVASYDPLRPLRLKPSIRGTVVPPR